MRYSLPIRIPRPAKLFRISQLVNCCPKFEPTPWSAKFWMLNRLGTGTLGLVTEGLMFSPAPGLARCASASAQSGSAPAQAGLFHGHRRKRRTALAPRSDAAARQRVTGPRSWRGFAHFIQRSRPARPRWNTATRGAARTPCKPDSWVPPPDHDAALVAGADRLAGLARE
jgi:hypothetical protein